MIAGGLTVAFVAAVIANALPVALQAALKDRLFDLPVTRHAGEIQRAEGIARRVEQYGLAIGTTGFLVALGAGLHWMVRR